MESIEQLLKMEKADRDAFVEQLTEKEQYELLVALLTVAPGINNMIECRL